MTDKQLMVVVAFLVVFVGAVSAVLAFIFKFF